MSADRLRRRAFGRQFRPQLQRRIKPVRKDVVASFAHITQAIDLTDEQRTALNQIAPLTRL
jgi:hypothetical protein